MMEACARLRGALAAVAMVVWGCGDDAEQPIMVTPRADCAPGERNDEAGGCCAAGTTPMPGGGCCPLENVPPEMTGCCPAGSMATEDGCVAAGVAPELCPEGF